MKRKQTIGREGILLPYLDTGERILTGEMSVYASEDFPADECSAAERMTEIGAGSGCAVRLPKKESGKEAGEAFLRAVYRASAACTVIGVIPSVVLPSEAEYVRCLASSARAALAEENIPFGRLRAGIVIETPSAAILADLLAPLVDFFVLDPELLAVSLGVPAGQKGRQWAESVARCMKMTCAAARREGISVLLEKHR